MAHVFSILQTVLKADTPFSILIPSKGVIQLVCPVVLTFPNVGTLCLQTYKTTEAVPSSSGGWWSSLHCSLSMSSFPLMMSDVPRRWSRCAVSALGVLKHDLKEETWIFFFISYRRGTKGMTDSHRKCMHTCFFGFNALGSLRKQTPE